MILIFLFIVMIILGLLFITLDINYETYAFGHCIGFVGTFCLITSIALIIGFNATANNKVQKNKIQYEGLRKRYEIINSEYEDVSKSDVISDITEWNKEVYDTKYWTKNPWTSWFNPRKIADNMEYIILN